MNAPKQIRRPSVKNAKATTKEAKTKGRKKWGAPVVPVPRRKRTLIPRGELRDRDDQPVVALRELGTGRTWELPDTYKEFWLGRLGCEIRIAHLSLADEHCTFTYTNGRLHVRDVSGKGVRIGRRTIERGVLRPGEVLGIGELSLLAMSDVMAGSASSLESVLGFGRHDEVDRVLRMNRESTILVIDPEHTARYVGLGLTDRRSTIDVDEPQLDLGYYPRSLSKDVTALVLRVSRSMIRPFHMDMGGLRRRIEAGTLRLVVCARSQDEVEYSIGRCPEDLPIIRIPTFAERRADHLAMFEKELRRHQLTLDDLGPSSVAALKRYEWWQRRKEIEDAAAGIGRIFRYGNVADAGGFVKAVPLHPWLNAVGLQFGQSPEFEATEMDRLRWASVMHIDVPRRRGGPETARDAVGRPARAASTSRGGRSSR